jgi:hypothetical protein
MSGTTETFDMGGKDKNKKAPTASREYLQLPYSTVGAPYLNGLPVPDFVCSAILTYFPLDIV